MKLIEVILLTIMRNSVRIICKIDPKYIEVILQRMFGFVYAPFGILREFLEHG